MARHTIWLTDEEWQRLGRLADESGGRTRSELISDWIKADPAVKHERPAKEPESYPFVKTDAGFQIAFRPAPKPGKGR